MSDALPKAPLVVTDIKGSGEPVNMRSVSCNDLAKECRVPSEAKQTVPYAQSTTSVLATSIKPGMILARSSDIVSLMGGETGAEGDSLKPWNSMCTIPLQSCPPKSPNKVHPFSGLMTSQLICTECQCKVF